MIMRTMRVFHFQQKRKQQGKQKDDQQGDNKDQTKKKRKFLMIAMRVHPKKYQQKDNQEGDGNERDKQLVVKKKMFPLLITKKKKEDSNDKDGNNLYPLFRRPRQRKSVSYVENQLSDSESDESIDDDSKKKNKTITSSSKRSTKKQKKKIEDSDNDSEFDEALILSEDEEDDDIMSEEGIVADEGLKDNRKKHVYLSSDDSINDTTTTSRKRRNSSGNSKTPRSTKKTKKTIKDEDEDDAKKKKMKSGQMDREEELLHRMQNASYRPMNNPQKMPKAGPYVDPVGIDPTHGIVEGIIATQVRKIGALLFSSIDYSDEKEVADMTFPIRLQTACSGTDAPSIALGLVKESLNKIKASSSEGKNDTSHRDFNYIHEMSCEIESFKQAYIGRNFPGVTLFPNITKLTSGKKVVDVYGREQELPEPGGGLFVAGTSCKDFSMLKTRDRIDIEDKGTSGETFLAAVEFLEQQRPPMAIFENVDGAPWAKMQEYITGRIELRNRNTTKAIKDAKKKADADNNLKFSINEKGQYVAEEIPRQVGMRAGSIVQGFVKGRHDDSDDAELIPLVRSDNKKKGTKSIITLGQMAKHHGIDLEQDTLVLYKKARYCTHLCKIDTKEYGLPQTRNRKYLFIWRCSDEEEHISGDDLGTYFQQILDHLKTPLLYSMDAFLLQSTHDRIRCFREALRSGPGLMVARERSKELDFYDWNLSYVKDFPLHKVFRQENGIAERSRWLTGWEGSSNGRRTPAPGLWPELVDMWNMRRCDMIDCFGAAVTRDAIMRDPLHHSFTWDLSQNVTRAPFRSANVGVCGCVTPGGELLLPHKGRTIMGYEKLLLQGIPFSRLLLGPETEVQLSDLAGNAMSVPVVCATMLSAFCAPQLRREHRRDANIVLSNYALSQKYEDANGAVLAKRGDLFGQRRQEGQNKNDKNIATTADEIFIRIAKDLARDAFCSSVLCLCESSGRMTGVPTILECQSCGLSICHECSGRSRTKSHDLKEICVVAGKGTAKCRPDPHAFERKLRCAVPSILQLSVGWEEILKESGTGLESYTFQLQQVDRRKGHWLLVYGAWEDYGSARQVAEIRVEIGRTGTLLKEEGLAIYLRCFAPSIHHENPLRGKLHDSARLIITNKFSTGDDNKVEDTSSSLSTTVGKWEIRVPPSNKNACTLQIVGSDPCPSQRIQVGLDDVAYDTLKSHKAMKAFIPNIKSRNNHTTYHPKWKSWPGTIVVTGDKTDRVNGTYQKLRCQHTVVHSALWRRDGSSSSPPMYIYFKPNVIRSGLDRAVIASTPSYSDVNMEICELVDWIPENALTKSTNETKAKFLEWNRCGDNLKLEVPTQMMSMEENTAIKPFHKAIAGAMEKNNSSYPGPILCEMKGLSIHVIRSLLEYNKDDKNENKKKIKKIDLVGRSGTRNAKRLSILAAPSLLKHAALDKLTLKISKWYGISSSSSSSSHFGFCEKHVPSRPVEKWIIASAERAAATTKSRNKFNLERVYDAEESNEYYQKLLQCPTAFEVSVDESKGKLLVQMNPFVAAHHAAASLLRGRATGEEYTKNVKIDYCLSELSSMGEPDTKEFHVPNSDSYQETAVAELELPLYKRQAKALTRMQAIERGEVKFSEEERSEHILPGIGWCLIARAAQKSPLRGGVLGDAIGSGKTVVTIALILSGMKTAHSRRNVNEGKSGATLVVVPPGLVKQWDDERKKFTNNKLKCITIDCTSTLKRFSVKEICNADMVIVPASIIEEKPKTGKQRPYTEHLSKMAGTSKKYAIPPAPSGYSQREAPTIEGTWVRNMASGPEIYVGNKGKQRSRDEQAYYGFCYSEAIMKLREKKFDPSERGVPLEYFTWERIIIDECHETLVTGMQQESKAADFKAQARRGAREFLGVAQTDISKRPLVATSGVWGLTGTPLLETEARVTELANLMGGTYLTGAAYHWRKEERESGRDLYLNQQGGTKSREYRCTIQDTCHAYVKQACQRNRGAKLQVKLTRKQEIVNMNSTEGDAFLKEIASLKLQNFCITPDQLGEKASNALSITASSEARHSALMNIIDSIQIDEPTTKMIIFANAFFGGHESALKALKKSGKKFCHVSDNEDTVNRQNEIISWFRHVDATDEDRSRPRILLLSFEQAAGHNLQEACHHVIMYDPMYSGNDAVADASVEEQALGRVLRQGQKNDVTVTRIVLRGPSGETCLDDYIVERNLDEDVLRAATSNFD